MEPSFPGAWNNMHENKKTSGSSYDRAPKRGVSQAQSRQDFKDYYQSENAAVNGI